MQLTDVEQLKTANPMDMITIDGHTMTVHFQATSPTQSDIYLTSVKEHDVGVGDIKSYLSIHVRRPRPGGAGDLQLGVAAMSREQLIAILQSGKYVIE